MGKKQVAVSLRKPPPSNLPDPDAFVRGASAEAAKPAVDPAQARAVEGPVVSTPKGDRREVILYLPIELARRLSIHCLEMDRDVSSVVADAITRALEPSAAAGGEVVARVEFRLPRSRVVRVWKTLLRALIKVGVPRDLFVRPQAV